MAVFYNKTKKKERGTVTLERPRPDDTDTPDEMEESFEDVLMQNVELIADVVQANADNISALAENNERWFKLLVSVLSNNGSMSGVSEDDMNDMTTVMMIQNKIIDSILTSSVIPPEIRQELGTMLMNVDGWDAMEKAKQRIMARQAQRKALQQAQDTEEVDD